MIHSESRKLVRDSEWMRVYQLGPQFSLYESKFLTDGLEVSPASIKARWKNLSPDEQHEFALAFSAKPILTHLDEEIVIFLMDSGLAVVQFAIAILLPRLTDREHAMRSLIDCIQRGQPPLDNYYQALKLIGDRRGIPALLQRFEEYRRELDAGKRGTFCDLFSYLECCSALLVLDGSQEYERVLSGMCTHVDERVRSRARQLLAEWKESSA